MNSIHLVIKRTIILIISCAIIIVFMINHQSPILNNSQTSSSGTTSLNHNDNDSDTISLNHNDNGKHSTSVLLEHCQCSRVLKPSNASTIIFNKTTCGVDAFLRGAGQKIVGYSFYGDPDSDHHKEKQYFKGIEDNLRLMPSLYPYWVMRLYHDAPPGSTLLSSLCEVACRNELLDLCYVQELPGNPVTNASNIFAMNWRFFPTLDPQVDLYVSRDLDSTMTVRETAAVKEWLESGKGIHSMRDHPWHGVPMVGASWGARLTNKKFRAMWAQSWKHILKDPITYAGRDKTGPDQAILDRYVWAWGMKESLQHDSYTCERFPGSIGFPTERKKVTNNFIASWGANKPMWEVCPVKCRRKKEWDHC